MAEDSESEDEQTTKKHTIKGETKNQAANKLLLKQITDQTKSAIFPAKIAMDIYSQFKKREVQARRKYLGNLDLAQDLKLGV